MVVLQRGVAVNDRVEWFVWSTGREKWERIEPTNEEIALFQYLHAKTVNGRHVAVCRDSTGRYVGGFHP